MDDTPGEPAITETTTDSPTSTDPTTEAPPEPRGERRDRWPFRRAVSERYLGGVAAGIADWLDVDPTIVRVAGAVAAVWWPPLVVFYLLAWVIVPARGETRPLLVQFRRPPAARELVGAVALAIGLGVVLPGLRPGGSHDIQVGVLLIAGGAFLLLRRARNEQPDAARSGEPGTPARVAAPAGDAGRGWRRPNWAETRGPGRPKDRPFLTPLTLSVLLVWAGLVAALDQVGVVVNPGVVVSVGVAIIGAALVVSAWRGRARGTVLLLPLLLPAWIAFAGTGVPAYAGIGKQSVTLHTGRSVFGFGRLEIAGETLHLAAGQVVTQTVGLTAGVAAVDVPFDADLRVVGRIGFGHLEVWDDIAGDFGRHYNSGLVTRQHFDRRFEHLQPPCLDTLASNPPLKPLPPGDVTVVPVPTTARAGDLTTTQQFVTPDGHPCDPNAVVPAAGQVVIHFLVGAGTVEVHRVQTSR